MRIRRRSATFASWRLRLPCTPTSSTRRTRTCSSRATSIRCRASIPAAQARSRVRTRSALLNGEIVLTARLGHRELGRGRLQGVEPFPGEALRQQLVGPCLLLTVEGHGHVEQPGRQEPVPDRHGSPAGRAGMRRASRSPAHSLDQRANRNSEDLRRDVVNDHPVHERLTVHDLRQQHRRGPERRAVRSSAGGHL